MQKMQPARASEGHGTASVERSPRAWRWDDQFRLLVESVQDYAIFMLDPEGRVVTWNIGAQHIKGYRAEEIIGHNFSQFYPDEDVQARKPQRELENAIRDGRLEDEGWRLRKDGSRFWANVIITALRDETGRLVGFGKVTRDFTDKMRVQEKLRAEIREKEGTQAKLADSEKSLRKLSLHLLRIQEEERRRIGRDLHDSLGQNLSLLKMKLDALVRPAGTAALSASVSECAKLTSEAIQEVRTISYLLYPPMLEEMGLKSAIVWYLEGFTKRSTIQTTFDVDPSFGRLARESEFAMFRVLQESLINVHRHSGSPVAEIKLFRTDGRAVLEVRDRGNGIPTAHLEEGGQDWMGSLGVGVRGMTERVRQLGGSLDISSASAGTVVIANIPYQEFRA